MFLSVGHDEYWSGQQRANVEAARDAGVHLAFLSGTSPDWPQDAWPARAEQLSTTDHIGPHDLISHLHGAG